MIHVVSAFIVRNGRVLLQQRSPSRDFAFCWESPGGKVEPGDTDARAALQRELDEEVGWKSRPSGPTPLHYRSPFEEQAGLIEANPFFFSTFGPPAMSKEFTVSFHHVVPARWWTPRLIDAEGLGWFTLQEMEELNLIPGNRRMCDQISLRKWMTDWETEG